MIARIDQLTTDNSGNLALFATYWLDGQQIGAHRFSIGGPVSRLVPIRNSDGLLIRLDGVPIPAEPAAEESLLAEQIGIQQEIVAVSPAYIAEFALQPVKAWRQKWEQSQARIAAEEHVKALRIELDETKARLEAAERAEADTEIYSEERVAE